ncbi:MAG: dihydropteroate synthase [Candidatus Eutrophobiaceae bacterium]
MEHNPLAHSQRPLIMGILNTTPDSFSDGGCFNSLKTALSQIHRMVAEGADIIDVGGESTRPGAERVSIKEQMARTLDIIDACRHEVPERIEISIDTSRAIVAEKALERGATIINDITGGTDDPEILQLAAARQAPICLMHIQGRPKDMQKNPHYVNVVSEVRAWLLSRAEAAQRTGVAAKRIILDPGIGFGKTATHNLQLLAGLSSLTMEGYPILLGTSRKGFLKTYTAATPLATGLHERIIPGCATTALGVQAGVRIFRVHDVLAHRQAADTAWDIAQWSHLESE